MLVLVASLLLIVVAAALVVAYVAYPQRGQHIPGNIPGARLLSAGLRRVVDRAGLDPDAEEAARGGSLTELHERHRAHRRRS